MKRERILALGLCGALCLATNTGLSAAESWSSVTMKPLQTASLDAGTKHVLSYFLKADGQCRLTLMIAEKSAIDGEPASEPAARMRLSVDAGETARFDTVEGKALEFACKANAQAMIAATIDRVALYRAAE